MAVACLVFLAAAFLAEGEVRYAFSVDAEPVDSPAEHISVEDLKVYNDKAVIDKENLIWARVEDTHSMEPVLNKNSISLELSPKMSSEIDAGDIISFNQKGKVIIHRVISVSEDKSGWFAETKGDNNKVKDPWKVRFNDVEGVVVGILY